MLQHGKTNLSCYSTGKPSRLHALSCANGERHVLPSVARGLGQIKGRGGRRREEKRKRRRGGEKKEEKGKNSTTDAPARRPRRRPAVGNRN